jgi:hypothetical protein
VEGKTPSRAVLSDIRQYLERIERGESVRDEDADNFLRQIGQLHSDVRITFDCWWRRPAAQFVSGAIIGILVGMCFRLILSFLSLHLGEAPLPSQSQPQRTESRMPQSPNDPEAQPVTQPHAKEIPVS